MRECACVRASVCACERGRVRAWARASVCACERMCACEPVYPCERVCACNIHDLILVKSLSICLSVWLSIFFTDILDFLSLCLSVFLSGSVDWLIYWLKTVDSSNGGEIDRLYFFTFSRHEDAFLFFSPVGSVWVCSSHRLFVMGDFDFLMARDPLLIPVIDCLIDW